MPGMTPVAWDSNNEEFTPTKNSEWYNYKLNTGEFGEDNTSNRQARWANVKMEDGSYFVWIPRYEYKIDTTGVGTDYTKAGIIYINFIETSKIKETTGYIIHPAFTTDIPKGGWESDLAGIWVAKFEMSMETNGVHTKTDNSTVGNKATANALIANGQIGNGIRAVSKSGVSSWIYVNIANCYENAFYYDRSKESHLMKNSEWGAVAYLTHSKYGRNGIEITKNNSSTGITGNAGNSINDTAQDGVTNAHNTDKGGFASSTGNITGIYDLNGNRYENTSGFNKAYSGTYFIGESYKNFRGTHFASTDGANTKYATAYLNNTTTGYDNYTVGDVSHVGDGIHEVYVANSTNWFSDLSLFVHFYSPFLMRGGACWEDSERRIILFN